MKTAALIVVPALLATFAAGFLVGSGRKDAIGRDYREEEANTAVGRVVVAPRGGGGRGESKGARNTSGSRASSMREWDVDAKAEHVVRMTAEDPAGAIAWVEANGADGERDGLFRAIAEEWAQRDPEGAFAWANEVSLAGERVDAIEGVIAGALEGGHGELAVGMINRLPPGAYRDRAMTVAIEHFAATDPDRAFSLAEGLDENLAARRAGRALAEALIETGNIGAAQQRLGQLPYGSVRKQLTIGIAERMAAEDVGALTEWIAQGPVGAEGDLLFDDQTLRSLSEDISQGFVRQGNAEEGVMWALDFPDPKLRDEYLGQIGEAWGSRSSDEAAAWVVGVINESGIEPLAEFAEGVFEGWIELDENAVFQEIEKIANPAARSEATFIALKELAQENPSAAAERLAQWSPADPDRGALLTGRLMGYWLQRDPEQASIWLREQPNGVMKDRGVEWLVRNVVRQDRDPATARAWMGEVQNPKIYERLAREVEQLEKKLARGR